MKTATTLFGRNERKPTPLQYEVMKSVLSKRTFRQTIFWVWHLTPPRGERASQRRWRRMGERRREIRAKRVPFHHLPKHTPLPAHPSRAGAVMEEGHSLDASRHDGKCLVTSENQAQESSESRPRRCHREGICPLARWAPGKVGYKGEGATLLDFSRSSRSKASAATVITVGIHVLLLIIDALSSCIYLTCIWQVYALGHAPLMLTSAHRMRRREVLPLSDGSAATQRRSLLPRLLTPSR